MLLSLHHKSLGLQRAA